LQAKKIYGQQDRLAIRSFSEGWWSRWGLLRLEIQLKKCCKSVIYPELWHVMAQRLLTSDVDLLGNKWGKPSFAGKKRGILNAKQPISKRESNHHPY